MKRYLLTQVVRSTFPGKGQEPLAAWQAKCLASAIAQRLALRQTFRSAEVVNGVVQASVAPFPAAIDPGLHVTPSTAPR